MNSQPDYLSPLSVAPPVVNFDPTICPTCGQEIPPDKLEEIGGRIAAHEREQSLAIAAQFEKQHAVEKSLIESKARADIEAEREQGTLREARARDEAEQVAEKRFNDRLAEAEEARAAQAGELQRQLTEVQASQKATEEMSAKQQAEIQAKEAEIATMKQANAEEIAHVQQVVTQEAEARFRETLAERESAVTEAKAKAQEAEAKLAAQQDQFNAQREILDKDKGDALNAEKARAFEETQKLTNMVADLQRALEKQTADEIGEGAEIDLYEALRKEFPDDDIRRIPKGTPGADILHVVMLTGNKCGTIIYDSKNHNQFRWEHVTKLRADQLAAQAEHAILSTRKFPQGTRQLHLHDGVLLANPARVVIVATMIRQHLQQLHAQRVSDVERESKTAALYEFIVSERCSSLLSRVDERAEDLLEEQQKEMKWHDNHWKKQGEAIRGIQKAKADLENQISLIIGTSPNNAAA